MAKEKTYTREQIDAMSQEELDQLGIDPNEGLTEEEIEAREAEGLPGSQKRGSLYERFRLQNEEFKRVKAENERLQREQQENHQRLLDGLGRVAASEKNEEDETPEAEPIKPKPLDVKALRRTYTELVRAGEFDKAGEIQDQIDTYQESLNAWRDARDDWKDRKHQKVLEKAVEKAGQDALTKAEQKRIADAMQEAAEEMFERFPFLNEKSDERDDDAIAAVISRRNALVKDGMNMVRALRQAVNEKAPRFAKINGYDENGKKIGDEEEDEGGDGKGKPDGKGKGESRAEQAIRKAAETANRQPPRTTKAGTGQRGGKKLDVSKMTDEELAKLSPEELAEIDGSNRVDDE